MTEITINVKNEFGACEQFNVNNETIIKSLAITFTVNN